MRAGSRAAEPMDQLAPGSAPPLPAFAVPHKRGWLLIPVPRGLLKPAPDLVWAMRVLPVERPALEHALDRLRHSHGPVSPKRIVEIEKMLAGCTAGPVYVSAFPDMTEFKKHARDIA